MRALGVAHELLERGLDELAAVVDGCAGLSDERLRVVADLRIARGLDYYTGTVFETRMDGFERSGRSAPAAATTRWPATGGRPTPASGSPSA